MNAPDWGLVGLQSSAGATGSTLGGCLGGNEDRSLDPFPKHTAVHERPRWLCQVLSFAAGLRQTSTVSSFEQQSLSIGGVTGR